MAGALRHREDWNRYAKRTQGKNFHQVIWDKDKRCRTGQEGSQATNWSESLRACGESRHREPSRSRAIAAEQAVAELASRPPAAASEMPEFVESGSVSSRNR